jgi:hypothetical protein
MYRLLLLLLALLPAADCAVLFRFSFGNEFQEGPAGFQRVSRVYRSPRYLWIGPVQDLGDAIPTSRGGIAGAQGEFRIGIDNGDYTVTLLMSDHTEPYGPFTVSAQDRVAQADIKLVPGQPLRPTFPVKVADHTLRLRFQAQPGQKFYVNGMILEGPANAQLQSMFENAPPDALPSRAEVLAHGSGDLRAALHAYCEWLLAQRLPNGFLGDYGDYGTSQRPQYYWYTSSYPIRTLLAGYQILDEPRYLAAVVKILDRLVEEQMPNGAFQQVFRGKPTRLLTPQEIDDIMKHRWLNMADVGCIVTALAVAAHYVEEPRKSVYRSAAQRYCDGYAIRWQKPSGAFTNGLEGGVAQTGAYSVATGTEAAAFAAVYAITGDQKYLRVAEKAATFLASNIGYDGRPLTYQDSHGKEPPPFLQPVTHFGDVFYQHDGILFAYYQSRDKRFRDEVRRAYDVHIHGGKGLLAAISDDAWWPLQDTWNNSKSAGMPLVFAAYAQMASDSDVRDFLAVARNFLTTLRWARRIGVTLDAPNLPWGGHSLQSWAGCSVAATGFAGLSVAEMLQPGIVWLR